MDIHAYLGVLRRGLVLVVLSTILGVAAGAGAAVQSASEPTYSATSLELLPNKTVNDLSLSRSSLVAPALVVNLEKAALPAAPNSPDVIFLLVISGAIGLLIGLLLASLRGALDRRVRTPRDVAAVSDVPVIGQIAPDRVVRSGGLVTRIGALTPVAESFRSLRARFDRLRDRREHGSFVVTAAGAGQGATTVTANLAIALANTAASVVVIDADLRGGALSRIFGVHSEPGLTEVLTQRIDLDAALQWGGASGLTVLPAGSGSVNPGELLATPAMRELLGELRRRFEVVLIDTPTIAAVTDAAVIGSFGSSTLLVVAHGSTPRRKLDSAVSTLAAGGGAPVGIVLNSIPRRLLGKRRPAMASATARPRASSLPELRAEATPIVLDALSTSPRTLNVDPRLPELEMGAVEPVPPSLREVSERSSGQPTSEVPVFDPPLPAELQFAGRPEFPIGRRAPRHQVGVAVPVSDPDATSVARTLGAAADGASPSRFAPDMSRWAPDRSVYAVARAPKPITEGEVPNQGVSGTVVTTVSIATSRRPAAASTPPPPITRLLPLSNDVTGDTGATVAGRDEVRDAPELDPVRVRASRAGRPPMPPMTVGRERRLAPVDSPRQQLPFADDDTISPIRVAQFRAELLQRQAPAGKAPRASQVPMANPVASVAPIDSLLGEIGGVPRVEFMSTRPVPSADPSENPAHRARESYELRSRELERAAAERLHREQQRLELSIREQLAYGKRELESVLENRLEDTIVRPARLELPARRRNDAVDGPAGE